MSNLIAGLFKKINNKKIPLVLWVFLFCFILIALISFLRGDYFIENIENFNKEKTLAVAEIFLILFFGYWMVLFTERKFDKKWKILIGTILLVVFITPPFLSKDVGAYLIGARNFAWFHVNPYQASLNGVELNNWTSELGETWWLNYGYVYGPIFLLGSSLAVFPNFFHLLGAVYFYKILVLFAYLWSVFLFSKMVKILDANSFLLFLYVINPAILIHGFLEGHNEIFIIPLVLWAIYFLWLKKEKRAYFWFLVSVFIKYNTLVLLPIFSLVKGKPSFNRIFINTGIAIAVLLFLFNIFGINAKNIGLAEKIIMNGRCLYACSPVVSITEIVFNGNAYFARIVLFLFCYGIVVYKFLFKRLNVLKFVFWALFILMFTVTKQLTSWHVLLLIPIGLLLDTKLYKWLVLGITFYSLFHCFGI